MRGDILRILKRLVCNYVVDDEDLVRLLWCHYIAETKATAALTAMQIRDWDKDAQEFVKKRRQIEAQAQN